MSLNIGRIIGIPVRIHYTLWLVLLLISWSLADGYLPQNYSGLDLATRWAIGIVSAIILFVSVFLHELSHSYIAKKNGLPIRRITLFFFGGVSEMSEEPKDPRLEVRMASTRLNSSHRTISYAVFCLKKKNILHAVFIHDD